MSKETIHNHRFFRFAVSISIILFVACCACFVIMRCQNNMVQRQQRRRRLSYFDPKTVDAKPPIISNKQQTLRLKPFYGREILEEDYSIDITALRQLEYITFGSSHTYGSGVAEEPGHKRKEAFPYLLSSTVTNLGIQSHNLDYPALCLESMLAKQSSFDVAVILELSIKPWDPNDSSHILGRRLRERFPDMIIIFVNHIYPQGMRLVEKTNQQSVLQNDIKDWAHNEAHLKQSSPLFVQQMKDYIKQQEEQQKVEAHWSLRTKYYNEEEISTYMSEMQTKLGSNTFFINFYHGLDNNGLKFMEHFAGFTCDADFHHPCHVGHRHYADAIQKVVQNVISQQQPSSSTSRNIHPWVIHDTCRSWFEPRSASGIVDDLDTPTQGFERKCYVPKRKCPLKLIEEKGSLTVRNNANVDQHLAIAFMATSPNHSKIKYPQVQVEAVLPDTHTPIKKVANPVTTHYHNKEVHVTKLLPLGIIPSGETVLTFTSLEPQRPTPFRLVSYLITDQKAMFNGIEREQ